jgi:hypothetical protein
MSWTVETVQEETRSITPKMSFSRYRRKKKREESKKNGRQHEAEARSRPI